MLFLLDGVASKPTTEFLEDLSVNLAQHNSGVYLTTFELRQLLQRMATLVVVLGEYAECHQYLIGVETRVVVAHVIDLEIRDRLDNVG